MKILIALISPLLVPFCLWASDWEAVPATYSVPVPEHLEAFSEFPIEDMQRRIRDGNAEYKYTLPIELTGIAQEVHFVPGAADGSTSSRCEESFCQVSYQDLEFDKDKVSAVLNSRNLSPSEFTGRMEVFMRFSGDPEGFIHFTEPKKTQY